MTARPKLTTKQWQEAVQRCLQGESSWKLAEEFGVSASGIRRRAAEKRKQS